LGLAVVALIILIVLGVVAGLVLARTFGAAAARNEKRPGGEQDDEKPEQTGSVAEDHGKSGGDRRQTRLFFGGAVAVLGIILGLAGAASAFLEATLINAVPATSLGMVLGVVGYSLGSRRLGRVAAVLSVVALLFGMTVSQGMVPGVEPSDHSMPGVEPRAE
jgi:hypothetical protein